MNFDCYTRLAHLPDNVHGFVMSDLDGNYNIYLNDALTTEGQHHVLDHELCHIQGGDLEKEGFSVEDIEQQNEERELDPDLISSVHSCGTC